MHVTELKVLRVGDMESIGWPRWFRADEALLEAVLDRFLSMVRMCVVSSTKERARGPGLRFTSALMSLRRSTGRPAWLVSIIGEGR